MNVGLRLEREGEGEREREEQLNGEMKDWSSSAFLSIEYHMSCMLIDLHVRKKVSLLCIGSSQCFRVGFAFITDS